MGDVGESAGARQAESGGIESDEHGLVEGRVQASCEVSLYVVVGSALLVRTRDVSDEIC